MLEILTAIRSKRLSCSHSGDDRGLTVRLSRGRISSTHRGRGAQIEAPRSRRSVHFKPPSRRAAITFPLPREITMLNPCRRTWSSSRHRQADRAGDSSHQSIAQWICVDTTDLFGRRSPPTTRMAAAASSSSATVRLAPQWLDREQTMAELEQHGAWHIREMETCEPWLSG